MPVKSTTIGDYTVGIPSQYTGEAVAKRRVTNEHDAIVKWNFEHPDNKVYSVKALQAASMKESAAKQSLASEGPVVLGNEFAQLHRIRQNEADAHTAADKTTGKKNTANKNQVEYVVKPALKDAGRMAGAAVTVAGIPTIGVAGTVGGLAGSTVGGIAGQALGSVIDRKAGSKWVAPTLGFVGGLAGFKPGMNVANNGILALGSRGHNLSSLYASGRFTSDVAAKMLGRNTNLPTTSPSVNVG